MEPQVNQWLGLKSPLSQNRFHKCGATTSIFSLNIEQNIVKVLNSICHLLSIQEVGTVK